MTRLTAIIIFVCVFGFLGLCVAFGSTHMAKVLIGTFIGGVAGLVIGGMIYDFFKNRKH